jgi:hypothetical protein
MQSGSLFRPKDYTPDRKGWVLWLGTDPSTLGKKKVEWQQFLLDTDYTRSVSSLAGRQYLLIAAFGPNGEVAGFDLIALEPERAVYLNSDWYKLGWADLHYGTPGRDHFFVTSAGLDLRAVKDHGQLDCLPELRKITYIKIGGVDPRQVTGLQSALVILPQ